MPRITTCYCANCIAVRPGGRPVSWATFYRHRKPHGHQWRPQGSYICTSCPEYPNGHSIRRAAYYKHIAHVQQLQTRAANISNSTRTNTSTTLDVDDSEPADLFNEFNIEQSGSSEQEEDSEDGGYTSSNYSVDIPPTVRPIEVSNEERLFLKLAAWSEGIPRKKLDSLTRMLYLYKGIDLPNQRNKEKRLRKITRIVPYQIDCCIGGCMAYTGVNSELDHCLYCLEVRLNPVTKQPRKTFIYIPLTSRLRIQYNNPERSAILKSYRQRLLSSNTKNGQRLFRDVFDGDLFLNFHKQELNLFSDEHDIALQLSLDGVRLDNRKTYEVSKISKLTKVTNIYR